MKKLFRKFRKYLPFFKAGSMNQMAYKFYLFAWCFITIIQLFALVFLWNAIYKNSADGMNSIINGFTFKEIIVYLIFANIFNFTAFDSDTLETIDDEIKDGTIAVSFIKPISYRLRFSATNFGIVSTKILILGLPLFVIIFAIFFAIGFFHISSVGNFLLHILLFFFSQILATALFDCVNYICGVLCFYTTSGWGINQTKDVLVGFLSGTMLPLSFFPSGFGKVLNFLPFAGMTSDPIMILLGKYSLQQSLLILGKNIFWLILIELLAKALFAQASKKVIVQGG